MSLKHIMTVNYPSQPVVDTFIAVSKAIGFVTDQEHKGGYVISWPKTDTPSANDEAAFYGRPSDFIDFVLDNLTSKVQVSTTEPITSGDDMKLHGIKLHMLSSWTPEAAEVYAKIAGIRYNANSLVPIGVNGIFLRIVETQRRLNEALNPKITVDELHRQYILNQAAEI